MGLRESREEIEKLEKKMENEREKQMEDNVARFIASWSREIMRK